MENILGTFYTFGSSVDCLWDPFYNPWKPAIECAQQLWRKYCEETVFESPVNYRLERDEWNQMMGITLGKDTRYLFETSPYFSLLYTPGPRRPKDTIPEDQYPGDGKMDPETGRVIPIPFKTYEAYRKALHKLKEGTLDPYNVTVE